MAVARRFFPVLLVLLGVVNLQASGPVGVYGIVERVVFEPNERAPGRIQVWGAFAYADGAAGSLNISPAKRGYLYFTVPNRNEGTNRVGPSAELAEWNDLKAVAGTGQAIAFGRWSYSGKFAALDPDAGPTIWSANLPKIFETPPGGIPSMTDMRVRSETERPTSPATYQTNAGIVKLSDQGAYANLVKELRAALKR
ncbi:MAG TPA: hypothetical protein VFR05_10695 [Terriglobia bacterium]|nr:hypothetical protein [Terriglobia bacterium]